MYFSVYSSYKPVVFNYKLITNNSKLTFGLLKMKKLLLKSYALCLVYTRFTNKMNLLVGGTGLPELQKNKH